MRTPIILAVCLATMALAPTPANFTDDKPVPSSSAIEKQPSSGHESCFLLMVSLEGAAVEHPGKATWNLDGSWTVDWDTMAELALLGPDDVRWDAPLIAKALLTEKAAGKLLENPHHDSTCTPDITKTLQ